MKLGGSVCSYMDPSQPFFWDIALGKSDTTDRVVLRALLTHLKTLPEVLTESSHAAVAAVWISNAEQMLSDKAKPWLKRAVGSLWDGRKFIGVPVDINATVSYLQFI